MADDTGAPASAGSAAASSAAPSTATPTASPTAAPATGAPATGVAHDSTGVPTGEPPQERWKDILENTRTKTRSEVEAEYRQKYGWADQFQTNPYGFVESWIDQLAQHPQFQQQMYAKAARLLQSRRGAEQTLEDIKPDVPIVDANGNVIDHTYRGSAVKKLLDRVLSERLQPLEQMREAIQQQAQIAELQQQSVEHARTTLTELRQNAYFKEHEPKVKAALVAHPEWGDNVHAAFNHVLVNEILPGLSQTEQRKVVDSLQQKANAATVSPSGGAPKGLPKFKNFADYYRYFEQHPEEAEAMANR